jgi:hypothetical protein
MRQYVLMLVALLSAIGPAAPAMAAKLKHQGSVYADSAGLSLRHPEGVACGENTFVVADTGNSRLVRYAISAQGMTPEAVYPLPGTLPIVVQVNSKGAIYLLDGKSRTLVKLDKNGQVIGKLQPRGLPDAQTTIPRSFKLGRDDNLYLLDIFSERVLVKPIFVSWLSLQTIASSPISPLAPTAAFTCSIASPARSTWQAPGRSPLRC